AYRPSSRCAPTPARRKKRLSVRVIRSVRQRSHAQYHRYVAVRDGVTVGVFTGPPHHGEIEIREVVQISHPGDVFLMRNSTYISGRAITIVPRGSGAHRRTEGITVGGREVASCDRKLAGWIGVRLAHASRGPSRVGPREEVGVPGEEDLGDIAGGIEVTDRMRVLSLSRSSDSDPSSGHS